MLFPIFGAEEEPGYLITTPVKLSVKIQTQKTITVNQGVAVQSFDSLPSKVGVQIRQSNFTFTKQSVTIGTLKTTSSKFGVFIRSGEGFVIMADVYPESFETAGVGGVVTGDGTTYPVQFIRPYLAIDGTEIPIVDFTYERPEGRLGALLNARLAVFEISGLEVFMRVDFGYKIYNPITNAETYVPRMTNGKLMGFDLNIAFQEQGQRRGPNDTVSISAVDIVADKFGLRPLRPVTMYDPTKTVTTEVTHFDAENALRLADGSLIRPDYVRVQGLNSGNALQEAYVFGLGFNKVVSNIPNYPISRADFGIEGGWHEGALPLFAMYGPLFFESFNTLFILNLTWKLPAGFTPRVINNSDYQRLSLIIPVKDYTNSIILTYKADAAEVMAEDGIYITYRFENETQTNDIPYGNPGYQRTETSRKIREVRTQIDPFTIISELEEQSKVEVFAQVSPGKDNAGNWVFVGAVEGVAQTVHRETQDNIYDSNGLKTSHHKTVQAAILNWTDGSVNLIDVLDEKCKIEWITTDDPNLMMQNRSTLTIEGQVAQNVNSRDLPMPDGSTRTVVSLHPVVAAQYNGLEVEDAIGGVFNPWVRIRTITETLRHTKGNQLDVEVKDFDNLTGTMRTSVTQPRTGTPITSLYQARMRHVLLEDKESIKLIGARIPAAVNAGELPRKRAFQLGWDVLDYIQTPGYDAQVIIAGIDLSIDRGSVIIPRKREEDASHFIVTGTTEHGEPKDNGFQISMTLKGQEVKAS